MNTNLIIFNCTNEAEKWNSIYMRNQKSFITILIPKTIFSRQIIFKHICFCTDLVESLKFEITDRTGIPVERINFIILGETVPDNISLFDAGLWNLWELTADINEEI